MWSSVTQGSTEGRVMSVDKGIPDFPGPLKSSEQKMSVTGLALL